MDVNEAITNFENYVTKWEAYASHKPTNEEDAIAAFVDMLAFLDDPRDLSFDGDGAYFGLQITIRPYSAFPVYTNAAIEIAYNKHRVSVYTANNAGYWVPEYISIQSDHPQFALVHSAIMNYLRGMLDIC